MHLDSLQVFCDVARLQSFSKAAERNHLSQSAVSQIVHQLEKRIGVQLLNRSLRPLQPTSEGKLFAEGCRALLEQYAELEASIRGARAPIAGNVRVAAIYSVGLGDMGETVEQFLARYPEATIDVEYLHPDRVYEKVLDGTVDLGLVSFPRKSRELAVIPWRNEEMVLVCRPSHPLAKHARIRPSQLHGERYVGFDKHLIIRRAVDRYLRDCNVAVDVSVEFDNVENIKKAVEVGVGVALLPEPTLRREAQAGTLAAVPLAGGQFVRPLGIIHLRQHHLGAMTLRFIELLRQPASGPVSISPRRTKPAPSARGRRSASRRAKEARRNDQHTNSRTSQDGIRL
jgi:DNA-binding transcriptional LysR family regulator